MFLFVSLGSAWRNNELVTRPRVRRLNGGQLLVYRFRVVVLYWLTDGIFDLSGVLLIYRFTFLDSTWN